ncbi:MAG TPA: alginate lyase family protein, partial [Polyangia bacterium]
ITGDSNGQLRAGLYGYQLAAAAELMRDYSGWTASDWARLKDMMVTTFYATCSGFLQRHNGTCFDHYWANWDLANMTTVLAVGVLTDDRAKVDEAVSYFKNGVGTGQVDRMVNFLYPGNPVLGQSQESGRDQGHATLVVALAGAFAKIAYDQGEDLFAYKDNKLLALAEYTAKYNLGEDVPWTNYTNCENSVMTEISSSGRGGQRPNWELFYNHYAKVKGLYAPNSQRFAEMLRPEGGSGDYGSNSGGFDQLGFGTLVFSEE